MTVDIINRVVARTLNNLEPHLIRHVSLNTSTERFLTSWQIKQAARAVARGGVIAYPTEAVFGLGCDPWNSAAIARIMQLKRRKLSKGLILIAADKAQLEPFIRFPNRAVLERVCSTWPGPVTWVLPACAGIPRGLRGDHQSLAVRVTAPLARALCTLTGALVSTSANPSGCPPARCVQRVRSYFKSTLDYILPGELGQESSPTEIRDALTGEVLRPS